MSDHTKVCLSDLLPVSDSYEIVESREFFGEEDGSLQFDFTIKILNIDEFYTLSFVKVLFEKQWFIKSTHFYVDFSTKEYSYYKKYHITQKAEIREICGKCLSFTTF